MGYCNGKRLVVPSEFRLAGWVIPAMTWDDRYKHLGILLGPDPEACVGGLTKEFRANTEKLFQSDLADWMKLEAFKEFLMPMQTGFCAQVYLGAQKLGHEVGSLYQVNCEVVARLPVSTCSAFFDVPSSQGGLGLRSIEDDLGSLMITQAVKMLTSPDPLVRGVAPLDSHH